VVVTEEILNYQGHPEVNVRTSGISPNDGNDWLAGSNRRRSPCHQYILEGRLKGTPTTRTSEDNKRHVGYLVKTPSGGGTSTTDVLVKFAPKNNEAAHRLLANHDPPCPKPIFVQVCHWRRVNGCDAVYPRIRGKGPPSSHDHTR